MADHTNAKSRLPREEFFWIEGGGVSGGYLERRESKKT